MGYDMTWRDSDGPGSYFRASIFDMAFLRRAMFELDMAYRGYSDSENPHPWPDPIDRSGEQEVAEPGEPACPDCDLRLIDGVCEECEADARWDAAAEPRRSWAPTPSLGICLNKLVGNDGWIVNAEECRSAVAAYDGATRRQRLAALRVASEPEREDADEAILGEVVAALGPTARPTRTERARRQKWFETWVDFLRGASMHDGFYVC